MRAERGLFVVYSISLAAALAKVLISLLDTTVLSYCSACRRVHSYGLASL